MFQKAAGVELSDLRSIFMPQAWSEWGACTQQGPQTKRVEPQHPDVSPLALYLVPSSLGSFSFSPLSWLLLRSFSAPTRRPALWLSASPSILCQPLGLQPELEGRPRCGNQRFRHRTLAGRGGSSFSAGLNRGFCVMEV